MNISFARNRFKGMLVIAFVIGALLGVVDATAPATSGQIGPETPWYCPTPTVVVGTGSCNAQGCKKYTPPDGHWVCDYVASGGAKCPPLNNCELPTN